MEIRISERKKAKIKLALQGSAGSGKTYSALLIAKGLIDGEFTKTAIIDTENGSADLYAHLGNYNVVTLQPPYSPERFIEAISLCEKAGMEVIIIDSISHCWDYLLDVHSNMPGNSFTNWGKITPRQNAFVNKILQSNTHIISTMRVKQDYVLNQKNGKMVPEKVGLKAIQRNDLDYEFTMVFDVDIAHQVKASKDRTGLFIDKPEFIINAATGKKIKQWCDEGHGSGGKEISMEIAACETLEGLRHIYTKYPEQQESIKSLILKRKEILERIQSQVIPNNQIIKNQENGIDSSK
ncbi:AAA family ATPase [Aureitalea sp. L0-47]|uniref:ATP-binding protein n=1 Tax=Aureitalea sp. L0-47 TaxID=2816962 RepID=UPI0022383815|nr:ATP-binding protein [Aureitalea sp. L0-47]MCW5518488.1 AAA family ATPase [Aureitalea sp. L0-47]